MLYFVFGYDEPEVPVTDENPSPEPEKKFTQDEINKINAKERRRAEQAEKELKEVKSLLDQIKSKQDLNDAEKAELAAKLEEIEQQKMSEQERREHEQAKLKKTFETEKAELLNQLQSITQARDEGIITRQIKDLAITGAITAADGTGDQLLAVLQHRCQVNTDGEVIVKNFQYTEDDQTFKADLPVGEAIEKMKGMKNWANFWKDPSRPGYNGSIESNKLPGAFKLTTFEQYEKDRAAGNVPYLKK